MTFPNTGPAITQPRLVQETQFKFGLFSQMPRFGPRELQRVRPRWFFVVFYPALLGIAVAVVALTA